MMHDSSLRFALLRVMQNASYERERAAGSIKVSVTKIRELGVCGHYGGPPRKHQPTILSKLVLDWDII